MSDNNQKNNNANTVEAYPLCWPFGQDRTRYPARSRFGGGKTFDAARKGVSHQIRLLGGTNIIISTNLPLRNDGNPYASAKVPDDRGIAVYFTYKNDQVVFACDKWNSMVDNMKAIEKTIEATRGLDRWGVSDMLNRVFRGFKAIGTSATQPETCWDILGIKETMDEYEIKKAFHQKAKVFHPDKQTGSTEEMQKLQTAYTNALQTTNNKKR